MKKTVIILIALSLNIVPQNILASSKYEKKIEKILKEMTLEEKVGQMAQLCLDYLGKLDTLTNTFIIDEQKLDKVIREYKVGSFLNTGGNIPLTRENWEQIMTLIQKKSIKHIGIPTLYGVDAIHGTTYTKGATFMPQQIGQAATFNTDIVEKGAKMAAYETRASNIPWNFSPVLDMGRDARWARIWETFGEDTYLTSEMGKAAIKGYQGDNREKIAKENVAACLKHFVAYGVTNTGKDREPGQISEMELLERQLPPFEAAIKEGALSVMINSAVLNGISVHANKHLITEVLKKGYNFDGLVVTDWGDIGNLHRRDKIAENDKEAIKIAINAGIDMSMIAYDPKFCTRLIELVNEGEVSIERIDDAVSRILRLKFRLGLFNQNVYDHKEYNHFGSESHKQLALQAAQESITLLKNTESILPLSKDTKVLVTGPNADFMRPLNGGWTLSWQGQHTDKFEINTTTILKAIKEKIGEQNVSYVPGVTYKMDGKYYEENTPDINSAVTAAKNVDIIIACIGENSYTEKPGDLQDLYLSDHQQDLIKALAATGKPIILILNQGRPRIISKIEPLAEAIIQGYLPGSFGGIATADILFGDINPSGRLPYTYPKYPNSLLNYDFKMCQKQEKMAGAYDYQATQSYQYIFGYGLSYTEFKYSDIKANKEIISKDETLEVSVKVTNTGKVKGKETIMLFSSDLLASVTPDNKRLRRFTKIELEAGESKIVTFELPISSLSFVDQNHNWIVETGEFNIILGTESTKIKVTE